MSQLLRKDIESSKRSQCITDGRREIQLIFLRFFQDFYECDDKSRNRPDILKCLRDNEIILIKFVQQSNVTKAVAEDCIEKILNPMD